MSVPEFHDALFKWPHPGASDVIVTGEFDSWSCKHRLSRTENGFQGTIPVPWGRKIAYKYIVDGRWTTTDDQPTEIDSIGNLNNVYNPPARPPTPKAAAPAPDAAAEQPSGQVNGLLTTAKNAAIAMVEAIAPGTTQTPVAETPAAFNAPPAEDAVETAKEEVTAVAEPTPEATPAPAPDAPTPKEEIAAEAVLPKPLEETKVAPAVPVPVLPLNVEEKPSALETTVVEGTVTSQPESAVEPSTHTPVTNADAPKVNGHSEKALDTTIVEGAATSEAAPGAEPSTHTPAPPTSEASTNGTAVEPSTHTPAAPAEKTEPATNGASAEAKPDAVPLPPPTPAEVPLPATPAVNGNGTEKSTPAEPSSTSTSPQTSPRKEKKHAFPTFGRHSRRSSSSQVSVATHSTDATESPSRSGTQKKKRTSSIFGKIKDIFGDHHDHKK